MEPIYQIRLSPGEKVIPGEKLPLEQLVVKWSIEQPDPKQRPSGLILARQSLGVVGVLNLDQWQLQPSISMDKEQPVILVQCPFGCELLIETVGYNNSLLSFYLYQPIQPIKARSFTNMGINYPPAVPVSSSSENIIPVIASNAVVEVPANPNRLGGYIENKTTRPMFVKWGANAVGLPVSTGDPFTLIPAGGNVEIETAFTGAISMIWSGTLTAGARAFIHEMIP
jgi:hypothetical protein